MSKYARTADPQTSQDAAAAVEPMAGTSVEHVLWVARKEITFTDEDLVYAYAVAVSAREVKRISPQRIRTARKELQDAGHVLPTGMTRPSQYGRQMMVWAVVK